ncbi:hypothetical protein D3C75_1366320 [compost metagenome]
MLTNDRQNIYPWIILMSENLRNFPFCSRTPFRIVNDTNNDLFPIHSAAKSFFWNKNITINPLIVR